MHIKFGRQKETQEQAIGTGVCLYERAYLSISDSSRCLLDCFPVSALVTFYWSIRSCIFFLLKSKQTISLDERRKVL